MFVANLEGIETKIYVYAIVFLLKFVANLEGIETIVIMVGGKPIQGL